ncbi:MAG: diguanylate cyclase [Actinomycetota bacterium]|nr:diguanylate cyclase [Actinomycetota bacterium]
MRSDRGRRRSAPRLFAVYALASLVPVVVLGIVLTTNYRNDTNEAGEAEAASQAVLLADDVVSPVIGQQPLVGSVPAGVAPVLAAAFNRAREGNRLVRLRLRDTAGVVVWADDGSGVAQAAPDDEVETALDGGIISKLTRLNSDPNDVGPVGAQVVEVYAPVYSSSSHTVIGVLEAYLPYAPIRSDVAAGLRHMYRLVFIGLSALWLVLGAISFSTTKRIRRQSERLVYVAYHDVVSGLLNRNGFRDTISSRLERDPNASLRLAFVDVARFREINEALGRESGDEVLLEIGRRFVAALGNDVVIARLGGDEFGVADFSSGDSDLHRWARRLQGCVGEPIETAGVPIHVEVAVGYDRASDGQSVDDLFVRADAALARAKGAVDKCAGFLERPEGADAARLAMLPRFGQAIEADELELYYQPKTSLRDGTVVAVEALVRWRLDGVMLNPGDFLPSVEQTALIHPFTDWVARTALEQLAAWGAQASHIDVAINVSARNLTDPEFAARLLRIVAMTGIDATRLIVEITETALLGDPDAALKCLRTLHDAGVAISIDDFGQGQTSLAYLAALPVDELKIDRAFVSRVVTEPTHAAIVSSVIELGHALGLRVVAEGVEELAQYRRVAVLGADVAQGYLIAKPMPAGDVVSWLVGHEPRSEVLRLVR